MINFARLKLDLLFGKNFHKFCLFPPVRLLVLTNVPTNMFIPASTAIPDFRVDNTDRGRSQFTFTI